MSLIEAVYLGTSVSRLYIIIVFEFFCSNVLIELHVVCVVKVHIFFPVSTEQISVDSQLNVLLRRTLLSFQRTCDAKVCGILVSRSLTEPISARYSMLEPFSRGPCIASNSRL
jgi:hypothetical protein